MKVADFTLVLGATPNIVPVFRVTKVPVWAAAILSVGDELFWDARTDTMRTMVIPRGYSHRIGLDIGASYLAFIDYIRI